ncbi:MAG: ABC transporter ATP-binding protein [Planctomycetes bacterium]|nr:ABC transporter ATP-binding protein [Planctomycetota bacterium]
MNDDTGDVPTGHAEARGSEAPAVVARRLTKQYDGRTVVEQLDLVVEPGTFFGFLGPNGAGKTTTIRMLCGLLRPSAGSATVAGVNVFADPIELKRRIGILPEEFETYARLTGREIVTFSGRMHGLPRDEVARRREALFEVLDLEASDAGRPLVDYSQGMRKKVGLACALIHSPSVLFLDEPFNGVDAVATRNIRSALESLTERGLTVFFSSHVMDVVERLCDEIAIIHQGVLRARGTLAELRRAAGKPPDTSLEDLFVEIVGGELRSGEGLDWFGG